jgi:zinc protease
MTRCSARIADIATALVAVVAGSLCLTGPSLTATHAAALTAEVTDLDAATSMLVIEDRRAPLVEIRIEFPVGTWSPWARDNHAEEAFEFQIHDPGRALLRRADSLAAELELSMGVRATVLSASCLAEDLPQVIQLIADVLRNDRLDESELRRRRREREIAREAAAKTPVFRRAQAVARVLYAPEDPRRRNLDRPDRIETRPRRLLPVRDTIVRLPGRVVAFAGAVSAAEAEPLARRLLPDALESPPQNIEPSLSEIVGAGPRKDPRIVKLPRLTQVYFALVRDAPSWIDEDDPAFLIANHVLGGHFYSRMYVALRHEGGETYGASAGSTSDVERGALALKTFTRADNAAVAESKLLEVLERFHGGGITETERTAAIGHLRGRLPFSRQAPGQILDRLLLERRLGLAVGFLDRRVEVAATLSLEQINEFIRRWYDPSDFTMIRVEPE